MDRRYQVFVSSTYEDLKEERFQVLKALLELDCIPCGMEYFPAASEDQWTYIRELIAECDYYIVIIAGRYGSTDEDGISYTEKEYDFAIRQGIPTIAFIHSDPSGRLARYTEATEEGRAKLRAFTAKVQKKLCKSWSTPGELEAVVSRGITQLIRRRPRPGWVRADAAAADVPAEIETLRDQLRRLVTVVDRLRGVDLDEGAGGAAAPGRADLPVSETARAEESAASPAVLEAPRAEPADLSDDDLAFLEELDRAILGTHENAASPAAPEAPPAEPADLSDDHLAFLEELDRAILGTPAPEEPAPKPASVAFQPADADADLAFLEELDRAIGHPEVRDAPGASSASPGSAPGPAVPAKPGKTRVCKECGAHNDPESWYCEICGSELTEESADSEPVQPPAPALAPSPAKNLTCKECGAINEPHAWYCEICGDEL